MTIFVLGILTESLIHDSFTFAKMMMKMFEEGRTK